MSETKLTDDLIAAWDEMDKAAFALMTTSVCDASGAASRLEAARVALRNVMIQRMTETPGLAALSEKGRD